MAPVEWMPEKWKLPVLYGDMVTDSNLGFSVCSGDQIAAYLAKSAEPCGAWQATWRAFLPTGNLIKNITRANFCQDKKAPVRLSRRRM